MWEVGDHLVLGTMDTYRTSLSQTYDRHGYESTHFSKRAVPDDRSLRPWHEGAKRDSIVTFQAFVEELLSQEASKVHLASKPEGICGVNAIGGSVD